MDFLGNTTSNDITNKYQTVVPVLFSFGYIGTPSSYRNSLAEAAFFHGFDVDELMDIINDNL